jgi:hypothetical protein
VVAKEISEISWTARPVGKAGNIGSDHFIFHSPFGRFCSESRPEISQAAMPSIRTPKGKKKSGIGVRMDDFFQQFYLWKVQFSFDRAVDFRVDVGPTPTLLQRRQTLFE